MAFNGGYRAPPLHFPSRPYSSLHAPTFPYPRPPARLLWYDRAAHGRRGSPPESRVSEGGQLEQSVCVTEYTARRRLYEPPAWLYTMQPAFVVFVVLGAALAATRSLSDGTPCVLALFALNVVLWPLNRMWSWLCRWRAPVKAHGRPLPTDTNSETQITVRGSAEEILQLLDGECHRFETLLSKTSQGGIGDTGRSAHNWFGWLAVGFVGLFILAWSILGRDPWPLLFGISFIGVAGIAVEMQFGPYLRIQHGRLELIRGRWFTDEWRVLSGIGIAGAKLTIDLEKASLVVESGEELRKIDLWRVQCPLRFVRRACAEAIVAETATERGRSV